MHAHTFCYCHTYRILGKPNSISLIFPKVCSIGILCNEKVLALFYCGTVYSYILRSWISPSYYQTFLHCSSGSWIRICRQNCYSYFFSVWRKFRLCSAIPGSLSEMLSTLLSLTTYVGKVWPILECPFFYNHEASFSNNGDIQLTLSDCFSCAKH